MSYTSDCQKCGQLIVHDIVEPFAHCGCGTTEWYAEQFTPAMHFQKMMFDHQAAFARGVKNLMATLQSKTHIVKYCKEFNLPAVWEAESNTAFDNMRWFDRVVTGLMYAILTLEETHSLDLPDGQKLNLFPLCSVDSVTSMVRVLEIKMFLPSQHNYFIYVPVDLNDFQNKETFDLAKVLKKKLCQFDKKVIVLVDRKTNACTIHTENI